MGAWIEIKRVEPDSKGTRSHPTMGAWIEIASVHDITVNGCVAPHDGCVD